MPIQDGRSTVAQGQVGTGAAQVFDTTAPVNAYLNNLERRRLEGIRKAQQEAKERKERKKNLEFDAGPHWSKHNEEIAGMTEAVLKADQIAFANGEDASDPTTAAGRAHVKAVQAIQNVALESSIGRKVYDEARSKFDPNIHDVNHFNKMKDAYDAAETVADMRKLNTNFLVESFDPYENLSDIKIGNVLSVYENEKGVTTTHKNRESDPVFQKHVDNAVDDFLGSEPGRIDYERGKELGMWEDIDGQEAWVRENVIASLPKEVKTTREKQSKSGGGLQFNFGNGSGGNDDFNLQYEMKQSAALGGQSDHEVVDIRGKKGKNFGAIQFTREDGAKLKLIPMEFERINGELFVVGKQVPEGKSGEVEHGAEAVYDTKRVRVKDNIATIKNHFDGLDVEDFMNKASKGLVESKSNTDAKVDEVSAEDASGSSSTQVSKSTTADKEEAIRTDIKDSGNNRVKVSPSNGNSLVLEIDNKGAVEVDMTDKKNQEEYAKYEAGDISLDQLYWKLNKKKN